MVFFFSVSIKYDLINPLNTIKIYKYVQYPFLVYYTEGFLNFNKLYNLRFYGMFDEPGVIGTIVTILLFADNYNLKSKQNIILVIAGIFSFSFFFIVSSLVYLFILFKNKYRILVICLVLSTFIFTRDNEVVKFLVWNRFIIEDGKVKGDNRSTKRLDLVYQEFLNSDDLFWGRGAKYTSNQKLDDASSYKLLVLNYGIIPLFIICAFFTLLAITRIVRLKYLLIYLFLVFGMIYQRTGFLFDAANLFIMFGCIFAIQSNVKKNENLTLQCDNHTRMNYKGLYKVK